VVQLGTIEIPAIGLKHRLYQGVTLHNIDRGPSHWTGSAMPGEMGNTVIAGHRSTLDEPFRRIDRLVPGDAVIFTVNGTRWTYRVTDHFIVRPEDSWIADQTTAFTGTLYACHPIGSAAERYVVRLVLEP
jgi:sortase A